jgi:hypothetical protein
MRTFKANQGIDIFGIPLVKSGYIIRFQDGETKHTIINESDTINVTLEQISNDSRFDEITETKQEINFLVDEIPDEEELEVKKFRIQLDVITNRRKLIEIENFMRKTLSDML